MLYIIFRTSYVAFSAALVLKKKLQERGFEVDIYKKGMPDITYDQSPPSTLWDPGFRPSRVPFILFFLFTMSLFMIVFSCMTCVCIILDCLRMPNQL